MAYKLKPNKAILSRFKVTKRGKLKRHHAKTSHLMSGRDSKTKRRLGRPAVLYEGLARNLELEAQHRLGGRRPGGTGTNRRSIDSAVTETENGPQAELFTQSGYGGYLEVGTSKMRAQPYLWPAFEQHIEKLPVRVKEKLSG